ncbi:hypothetical protein P154DRAFT_254444 [Amniculicola lignicola CBS 123094]|uniref:Uncharacterized protein n=1 Tax=Amniculicola lignicola CBS 123094 TaxID=1392246 RepID=A0A6A5WWP1_9PLEO|nr:hypothetical protein P154DRAFT_254444 [Amniculicola lignicola CBS 123094]
MDRCSHPTSSAVSNMRLQQSASAALALLALTFAQTPTGPTTLPPLTARYTSPTQRTQVMYTKPMTAALNSELTSGTPLQAISTSVTVSQASMFEVTGLFPRLENGGRMKFFLSTKERHSVVFGLISVKQHHSMRDLVGMDAWMRIQFICPSCCLETH